VAAILKKGLTPVEGGIILSFPLLENRIPLDPEKRPTPSTTEVAREGRSLESSRGP